MKAMSSSYGILNERENYLRDIFFVAILLSSDYSENSPCKQGQIIPTHSIVYAVENVKKINLKPILSDLHQVAKLVI